MHSFNKSLFNAIPHAAAFIDTNYIIQFINNSFHESYKLDEKDITGRHISSVFNKKIYTEKIKPRLDECLEGKHIHDIIPITPGDASSDIIDVDYRPVYNDDNRVNGIVITPAKRQQKQTIHKQELSSGHLLKILNTVEDVVILINPDHTIENINSRGVSLLNKTLTEIQGKKCYDMICGHDGPPDFCPLLHGENISLNESTETYFEHFGKYFSLKSSPVLDDQGNIIQYIDVMRDIDKLKRAELNVREKNEEILTQNEEIRSQNEEMLLQKEQIQESKEEIAAQNEELQSNLEDLHKVTTWLKQNEMRLSTAEEIAGMGSWEYNINTGKIWYSNGLYQLFDIPPINNRKIDMDMLTSFVHPDDKERVKETLTKAIKNQTSYKFEHKIINSNNKTIDIISQGHIEYDEMDHATKLKGILLDITERKKATAKIIKNNKRMKALTHFRKSLLHTNDEQLLIENTCKIMSTILEYPVVLISKKINNPSKDVRVIASHGFEQEYAKNIPGSWGDNEYGQGPGGLCIKTGQPQVNLLSDPSLAPWYDKARHHHIRSLCAMPVYVHDEVIGTIAFYSHYEDTFTGDELDFLQNIANDLSFGIEKIRENNKRIEIQKALLENEQKLSAIFRGAPIIMMLLDSKGRVLKINDPALVYAKKTRKEALNLKTGEIFGCINAINNNNDCGTTRACQECNIWNTVKKTFDTKKNMYKVEAQLTKNVNGVHNHYQLLISTALFSSSEPDTVLVSIDDITQRKKAEKQIQQALQKEKELNDLRSQFVSTVTHEFRTPLAGIYSNTQLLDRYHERWDKTKKERSFKRIYSAVNTMSSLLEDVSILGKEQSGRLKINPEDTYLYDYIESLAEEANETNNDKQPIKIINSFPCKNVRVDRTLLRHIMINVFTNALKYSSEDDPAPELTIRAGDEKNTICFILKDHGKGIPGHELKNIFQPFYRASNIGKEKGTGLGMSIVKRSIEIHGGTIDVQSEEGKGTTVTMQISFFI